MNVINLWGGPGSGKSTTAAGLFHDMKLQHYNVELVTEYAKQLVWAECWKVFDDQAYIFAKQNHRMWCLEGKVDYVVTDSPLPLSLLYMPAGFPESFAPFVMDMFNCYTNINILLTRVKPYQQAGRYQDEAGARAIDEKTRGLLHQWEIPFVEVPGDELAPSRIFDFVEVLGMLAVQGGR